MHMVSAGGEDHAASESFIYLEDALVQPIITIVNSYYSHDHHYDISNKHYCRGQPSVTSINQD